MISGDKKEWSILIYANGNNELEPEIAQSKAKAEIIGSDKNVNVVMQIAREDRNLARILRPFDNIPKSDDEWTGVRRYLIGLNNSKHLETLDEVNMSDGKCLYNFIVWAVKNFPARHYMLILGGHGYQFVGCMTDYSGRIPYIMGIPELCNSIDFACEHSQIKIDILLMDTCYSNFIEVVYELGKLPEHGVLYMLTYIINGPLVGLPYNEIISLVQISIEVCNEQLIKLLLNKINYNIVAFKIDYHELNNIKNLFNDLAKAYDNLNEENKISLPQLFIADNNNTAYNKIVDEISTRMNVLILGYKRNSSSIYPLINVANKPAGDKYVIRLYNKLAFSHNNYWTKFLFNVDNKFKNHFDELPCFNPVVLSPKAVYAYISLMNKTQSSECKSKIFFNLIKYKKWRT